MKLDFTSLRQLLRIDGKAPAIHSPDLGLTERDIANLRSWRASEEFESWLKLLDVHCKLHQESLIQPQSRDASALHETRGVIIGLRESAFLVDKTLYADDERSRIQQQRATADERPDPRAASLFASPFWP